jgi:hypothetical protein
MQEVEEQPDFNGRNRGLAIGIGLSPLWLTLLYLVFPPTSFGGGLNRPTEAQLLAARIQEFALLGLVGVLMVAGTIVIWRARSARTVLAAMFLLTVPALVLLIMGPAFLLILGNLTTPSGT